MASFTKAAPIRVRRSWPRESRRFRLIQAKVRSTIQRLGQDDEASNIAALHDLERPITGAGDERAHLRSGVAAVGTDALDER